MAKLTEKEAAEAKLRREAYEHSMAIEGIFLTDEEKKLFETIDRERMGYDEGEQYVMDYLVDKKIIDAKFHSRNKK